MAQTYPKVNFLNGMQRSQSLTQRFLLEQNIFLGLKKKQPSIFLESLEHLRGRTCLECVGSFRPQIESCLCCLLLQQSTQHAQRASPAQAFNGTYRWRMQHSVCQPCHFTFLFPHLSQTRTLILPLHLPLKCQPSWPSLMPLIRLSISLEGPQMIT